MPCCMGSQSLAFWSPEWEQRQKFLTVLFPVYSIVKTIEWSCQNSKQAGNRHTGGWREQGHTCDLVREGVSVEHILQHSHLCYTGAMLIPVRLYPPPHNYLLLLIRMLCPGLLGSDHCLWLHTANCMVTSAMCTVVAH